LIESQCAENPEKEAHGRRPPDERRIKSEDKKKARR